MTTRAFKSPRGISDKLRREWHRLNPEWERVDDGPDLCAPIDHEKIDKMLDRLGDVLDKSQWREVLRVVRWARGRIMVENLHTEGIRENVDSLKRDRDANEDYKDVRRLVRDQLALAEKLSLDFFPESRREELKQRLESDASVTPIYGVVRKTEKRRGVERGAVLVKESNLAVVAGALAHVNVVFDRYPELALETKRRFYHARWPLVSRGDGNPAQKVKSLAGLVHPDEDLVHDLADENGRVKPKRRVTVRGYLLALGILDEDADEILRAALP